MCVKTQTLFYEKPCYLLQVLVTVDVLSLVLVLKFVCLDILPQGIDDNRACLGVDAEKTGEPWVEFELHGLVVEHQQDGTLHILVARPLDLKPICLLCRWSPMPLQ